VLHLDLPQRRRARVLRGDRRAVTEGREGNRVRNLLMVSQVALALVLLVGAGLMARTFQTLRQVDPGFRDPGAVQTFQLTIPAAGGGPADSERTLRTQQAILDRLAAVGGVQSAGFSAFNDGLPLDGDGRGTAIVIEGRLPIDGTTPPREVQFVSPAFFDTLRTPLIAGRTFDWNDIYQGRRIVLVSENLARAEWGSANAALGNRITPRIPVPLPEGAAAPWFEVVGVVKDVHHNGLNQAAPQVVAFPAAILGLAGGAAVASETASFVIRSERAGAAEFLGDLQEAIWSVNATVSPANVQTLGDLYERSLARTSMTLLLLGVTGTMALLLGLIGIYGVVSYAVSQRRREIGIRLALGAAPGEIRRMFVRHVLVLAGVGVAIGLGGAATLTRLMASQLFGVAPLDPATHLTVAVGLMAAAGLASYLSARRASALDPVEVLKAE
jgi:predicted permease